MKKLLLIILTFSLVTTLSAQNQKVRVGLFKKWYIGAFEEAIGQYSIAIDTLTNDYELDEDDEGEFWSDQNDYHNSGVYDSLRLIIKRDTVLYDNEVFDYVYTWKKR